MESETRYARNGDVHLAYQVVGDGPFDLVYVPSWIGQMEHMWTERRVARFFERLASFSRLILFDRRGTGMSDRISAPVPLEEQMDDVVAVMDAAGSSQAALFAQLEAGAMAALFAATHPERTRALVLYAAMPRFSPAPDYDWPPTLEERRAQLADMMETWGDGSRLVGLAPDAADDVEFRRWFAKLERLATPPGSLPFFSETVASTDVRGVLPLIQAPTLVLHREGDEFVDPRHSRYTAEHVAGAKLVMLPGASSLMTLDERGSLLDHVEEFLTGTRRAQESDRVLATVLFTDIVDSTRHAARLGDRGWRSLLHRHDELVRERIERYRGRAVKSLGDGYLATFDGPARGIRAAREICRGASDLGVQIRAGLHTGECEVIGDDVGGLAVHIGARIGSLAGPGEVLVSGTVRDLVVGSGIDFDERGEHELRGVPGTWRLFAAHD